MNPLIVFLVLVAATAVSVNCNPVGEVREERGLFGMAGSLVGAANSLLMSKEQNRASCEYYGYIDPEFRKGTSLAEQGVLLGGGSALVGALAPEEALREGCITQGWYHPNRPQVVQAPPQYVVVQNPPQYVQGPPQYYQQQGK